MKLPFFTCRISLTLECAKLSCLFKITFPWHLKAPCEAAFLTCNFFFTLEGVRWSCLFYLSLFLDTGRRQVKLPLLVVAFPWLLNASGKAAFFMSPFLDSWRCHAKLPFLPVTFPWHWMAPGEAAFFTCHFSLTLEGARWSWPLYVSLFLETGRSQVKLPFLPITFPCHWRTAAWICPKKASSFPKTVWIYPKRVWTFSNKKNMDMS